MPSIDAVFCFYSWLLASVQKECQADFRNGLQTANERLPRTYTAPCIYRGLLTSRDRRCVPVNVTLRGFPRLSTSLQKFPILRCWPWNRSCWRRHPQPLDFQKYSGNWGPCAAERHLITSWNTGESPRQVFNCCKAAGDILHNIVLDVCSSFSPSLLFICSPFFNTYYPIK